MATADPTPEVRLKPHEREPVPDYEDGAWREEYADHETVAPVREPYVLLGYGPRMQLFNLFVRSRRALTVREVHERVEGDPAEVAEQMRWLLGFGILRQPQIGRFALDWSSKIAVEIADLFEAIEYQSSDLGFDGWEVHDWHPDDHA